MFDIDEGVPEPAESRGGATKYPFKRMKPGDSFFVPLAGRKSSSVRGSLSGSAANALGRGGASIRAVTEGGRDGFRVWRK